MDTDANAPARRAAAFTLIEVLVVIAIIGVLMSILLPTLAAARRNARTAVCLSQSRQIVTAMAAFAADHRGQLPENRPLVAEGQHITWRQLFVRDGLVPKDTIWTCPLHPGGAPAGENGIEDNGTLCVGDVSSSYAINGHVAWRERKRNSEADRPDAAIARPSHTIILAETNTWFPDIRVTNQIIAAEDQRGRGLFGFWHSGKGVYGFLDGHAETLHILDTGSPDCRWHNGKDLTVDPVNPQPAEEFGPHAHPDWELLLAPVYRRSR